MAAADTVCSFRDPSGTVFSVAGRIFRKVSASAAAELQQFLGSPAAQKLTDSGKLISTREATGDFAHQLTASNRAILDMFGPGGCTLEHDRVWFASYPYEWPPEMLYQAAVLTLDVAEAALADGFGLKDATPYNVLFRGPNPVFVDVLSFERRAPGDATWLAYAQFVRMFLLPLLARKHLGMGLDQSFLSRTHGMEPEEMYDLCNWATRLRAPFLTEVTLPTWLKKKHNADDQAIYRTELHANTEKARFILEMQFRRLRRALRKAAPQGSEPSTWASYMSTLSYSEEDFNQKQEFVQRAATEIRPHTALDIGCNTGHFSAIAARSGARVVALDLDPVVVGNTWRRAASEQLDILPLVVNAARPTPATGWKNSEYASFLDRAAGAFELVMMLATIHHLLVTERIPLDEIVNLAAGLTSGYAILEYVAKDDPMFRRLLRGRDALHADFSRATFESAIGRRFEVVRSEPVKGDLRRLYLLRKRS